MLTSGWNLTWECSTSTIKTLDLGINLLSSKSADFIFCQMCLITDQVLLAPTLAESNPQTARGIDSTQHDSLNIITFHAQVQTFHAQVNKKPSITSIFAIPNEWLDIQNMLSLSDKVIISQFKWNFRKRTDFCLPLWKARYLQHNAAVRAMVPQGQLLIYKVFVQGDFFTPLKGTKK